MPEQVPEAVEAAAEVIWNHRPTAREWDGLPKPWPTLKEYQRELFRGMARAALAAALPHLSQPVAVVHCEDAESRARHFNEGYEAAMAQQLADDPTLAEDWLEEQRAKAWDEGRASGFSRAMRRMSDEPTLDTTPHNPYRAEAATSE